MTDARSRSEQRVLGTIRLGDRLVDLGELAVFRGAERVPLTRLEARVLDYLNRNPSRDVPKGELLREVWGYSPRAETRAIEATIHRLRAKLEDDARTPRFLHTSYGVGYRLEPGGAAVVALVGGLSFARAVASRLDAPVAISGLPGTGKTRTARELSALVPQTVWWVDAPTHPLPELFGALSAATASPTPGVLVVDDVPDTAGAWEAIAAWRERRPGWRLLVTTRSPKPPEAFATGFTPLLSADEARALATAAMPGWGERDGSAADPLAAAGGVAAAVLALASGESLAPVRARFAAAWEALDPAARALIRSAARGELGQPLTAGEVEWLVRLQQCGWLRAPGLGADGALPEPHPLAAAIATDDG